MQQRVPLLHKQGVDELFFAQLNARSFYFCDPAGIILEYIVHYHLNTEPAPAPVASVLHVSEIGLPVEDVPAFADRLDKQCALRPYGGSSSEQFAFLGDISGQVVVVKIGHPWLPTETVLAQALLQEEVLEREQVLAIVNGALNIPGGARSEKASQETLMAGS